MSRKRKLAETTTLSISENQLREIKRHLHCPGPCSGLSYSLHQVFGCQLVDDTEFRFAEECFNGFITDTSYCKNHPTTTFMQICLSCHKDETCKWICAGCQEIFTASIDYAYHTHRNEGEIKCSSCIEELVQVLL